MENQLEKVYKKYFYTYLNTILNINNYDKMIDNSNLYFDISKTYYNECQSMFKTKYIRCLNKLYINKISKEDEIKLLDNNVSHEDKFKIIHKTLKSVITKDNVKNIMYDYDIPERIIKNGTLVFEIDYGKNNENLDDSAFFDNMKKQNKLLNSIKINFEREIKDKLGIEGIILIQKVIQVVLWQIQRKLI